MSELSFALREWELRASGFTGEASSCSDAILRFLHRSVS